MRLPRPAIVVLAGLVLFDAAIGAASVLGLRVNTTASMPLGVYHVVSAGPAPLARGMLVAVCPPAAAVALAALRGYFAPGPCPGNVEPLLKRIAAVRHDTVNVSERGVAVNGRPLANGRRVARDCNGRPLPHIPDGRYTIGPGSVWLYAPVARSWDSRYYGAVPAANVIGLAVPVWIVGDGRAC